MVGPNQHFVNFHITLENWKRPGNGSSDTPAESVGADLVDNRDSFLMGWVGSRSLFGCRMPWGIGNPNYRI